MSALTIDRKLVETFLEECNHTNFMIAARGSGFEGGVTPTIEVKTHYFSDGPEKQLYTRNNGNLLAGQERVFSIACNYAKGGDYIRAIEALVSCEYYKQVEVSTLKSISVEGVLGIQPNPIVLEPLVWRRDIETNEITAYGGARAGAGRPNVLGDSVLLSFDAPKSMRDAFDAKAKAQGVSRAERLRALIAKDLAE